MAKGKEKQEKILEQTRGQFRAIGKVVGVERDNYFSSGIIEKGKMADKEYRSLRFGIKTSPSQTIYVQMFGIEPEVVYVWNNTDKKMEKHDYDKFLSCVDEWASEGNVTFDSAVNLESTDKKAPKAHMPKYDNIDLIYNQLENGMSVYVSGNISRKEYKEEVQTSYDLTNISLADDIDFEDKKFREYASFTEDFVLIDTEYIKDEERLILHGKVIDYAENAYDVQYDVSHARTLNGEPLSLDGLSEEEVKKNQEYVDEQVEMKERMIRAFKKLKFGTLLKCDGKIINKVVVQEVEEPDENPLLAELRGNSKKQITDYTKTLSITGTKELTPDKYSDDDFLKAIEKNELVKEKVSDKKDSGLGDLAGKNEDDPFGSSSQVDISDDDLPF